MRTFLFSFLLVLFAGHQGWQWFNSPQYLEFILRNKKKPWAGQALLQTARYQIFMGASPKAEVFLDHCLSEDFEKIPERADCFYEKGRLFDDTGRKREALGIFEILIKEYPGYPKEDLVQRRIQSLRSGF